MKPHRPLVAPLAVATLALALSACSPQRFFLKTAWVGGVDYVAPPELAGMEMSKVAENVYTFRSGFYRNLVVVTDQGLVVTDPMGVANAKLLKAELDKLAPGVPVHTLIYSHHHLDHVTGGAVLNARNVLAHSSFPRRWAELGAKDIAPPTRLLDDGDQTLTIGGVELRLVFLPRSHSEALYAFYLPKQKVLHSVDMGFVRMIPPLGIPDSYMPGVVAALDKMAALDFDVWLPSHYLTGKKADLLEYIQMTRDLRQIVAGSMARHGGVLPADKEGSEAMFAEIYDPFEAKYGTWHGFGQQSLVALFRESFGQLLGY